MENWISIKGYEENYLISNQGRVKTLSRPIYRTCGRLHYIQKEKLLKPSLMQIGYYYIGLHKDKKMKLKTIHSLVAEHFIENPSKKRTVNHIDGNKLNNHIDNLEWATDSENLFHALETKLRNRYGIIATCINTGNRIIFDSVRDTKKIGINTKLLYSAMCGDKIHKGYKWEYTGNSAHDKM